MSDKVETQSQVVNVDPTPIDLRTELKRSLADEYETAISLREDLTNEMRKQLVGLVRNEEATTDAILKVISED